MKRMLLTSGVPITVTTVAKTSAIGIGTSDTMDHGSDLCPRSAEKQDDEYGKFTQVSHHVPLYDIKPF